MTDFCILYVTCKDQNEASVIAKALLQKKLIACGNIIPQMTSIYEWNDQIEEQTEVILLLKTSKKHTKMIEKIVLEKHSYDCPCVLEIPLSSINSDFKDWLEESIANTHS